MAASAQWMGFRFTSKEALAVSTIVATIVADEPKPHMLDLFCCVPLVVSFRHLDSLNNVPYANHDEPNSSDDGQHSFIQQVRCGSSDDYGDRC